MKYLTLFSVAILALTVGCDDAPAQNNGYGNNQYSQATPDQYQNQNNYGNQNQSQQTGYNQAPQTQNNAGDGLVLHPMIDKHSGQHLLSSPVPSSWKFNEGAAPGQPRITGPNGLSVTSFPLQEYMYTNDAGMNQSLQSVGQKVMAPVGIANVMSQQIVPQGREMGMTFIKQYPLPRIEANEVAFIKRIATSNVQSVNQVIGSEWTDREGNKVLVVLHYFELNSPTMINWNYSVEMVKVKPDYFEQAKGQFIYALSNSVFNESGIYAHKAQQLNESKMSNDHYTAMDNIRRKGQNDRAKINADADKYVRNLQNQGNAFAAHNNDVVQQQQSNYLNDVNVVVSPYDGNEYQVKSGAQTNWMDNQGNYIQSNDVLYDPNNNEDYQGTWQQAPNKVYE